MQTRQRTAVDKTKRGGGYQIGDLVFLSTANLSLNSDESRKLIARYVGPFEITDLITDVTVRLRLPDTWRIHNSFHVSRLKPAYPGTDYPTTQTADTEDSENMEDVVDTGEDPEYEIERILNSRIRRGFKEYLIRWKGYDSTEDTWEPASAMTNAAEAIADYDRVRQTRRRRQRR